MTSLLVCWAFFSHFSKREGSSIETEIFFFILSFMMLWDKGRLPTKTVLGEIYVKKSIPARNLEKAVSCGRWRFRIVRDSRVGGEGPQERRPGLQHRGNIRQIGS